MMSRMSSLVLLGLVMLGTVSGCHRAPSPDQSLPKEKFHQGEIPDTKDLVLKKGMEIKIVQTQMALDGKIIGPEEGKNWVRSLKVDNPSGAEGLAFEWTLNNGKNPGPESLPAAPSPSSAAPISGKMTLANTVTSHRMTLPLFWPPGELFLSNSAAIWLSDQAFDELKKQGKTQWALGVLDNPLLGPVQGVDLLEQSLESASRGLEGKPEKKTAVQEIQVTDKSADFPLKINGTDTEVDVIEAGNWLANYKILNNPQNPLIVEVEVAPQHSTANLFSPLSWIRGLLSYKVEEIVTP